MQPFTIAAFVRHECQKRPNFLLRKYEQYICVSLWLQSYENEEISHFQSGDHQRQLLQFKIVIASTKNIESSKEIERHQKLPS